MHATGWSVHICNILYLHSAVVYTPAAAIDRSTRLTSCIPSRSNKVSYKMTRDDLGMYEYLFYPSLHRPGYLALRSWREAGGPQGAATVPEDLVHFIM
jgi:hypothetical protein